MKPVRILGLAVMVLLTDCAAARRAEQQKQSEQIAQQCETTLPRIVGNFVARSHCLDGAVNAMFAGSPDMDLIIVYEAQRHAIAADIDAGKITIDAGQLQIAQAWSAAISQSQVRDQSRAAIAASNAAATAAILSSIPQYQPPPVQPYVAQPYVMQPYRAPVITNCNRFGTMTNCVSQ